MTTVDTAVAPRALERRKPPASVRRRFLIAVADHSLLIAVSIMFLAPFVFIGLTALMTNEQALSPRLWPEPFQWGNFVDVFQTAPIWRYALNTMLYAGLATVGVLLSSIPVAYALSRLRWRGRDAVFVLVLVALILPFQVTVIPIYVLFAKLHLVGSLWPLIIPNFLGDAFSIFLLRQFFLTIPEEYADAARVDGCGEIRILCSCSCASRSPQSRPSHCSSSSSASTTSSGRCCTRARTRTTGRCPGSVPVPDDLPGRVEPDDGSHAPLHGARDRPLLPRAAGVRRGRDADGGQG